MDASTSYSSSRYRENQQPSTPGSARLRPVCQTGLKNSPEGKRAWRGDQEAAGSTTLLSARKGGWKPRHGADIIATVRLLSWGRFKLGFKTWPARAGGRGGNASPPPKACDLMSNPSDSLSSSRHQEQSPVTSRRTPGRVLDVLSLPGTRL